MQIEIVRKNRLKRWRIVIKDKVYFYAPRKMSDLLINNAIAQYESWIKKSFSERDKIVREVENIYAQNSGKIPLFGEWVSAPENVKEFYKLTAQKFFNEFCEIYAEKTGVKYAKITIKDQKTRYGSCSVKGSLNFNFRAVKAPKYVAEYLVAHEIAHLKHLNHGKNFWRLLSDIFPQYKEAESYLKNKRNALFLRYDNFGKKND
jgi:predicted metal-dependent hydrolase